jgi:hypothetical protein
MRLVWLTIAVLVASSTVFSQEHSPRPTISPTPAPINSPTPPANKWIKYDSAQGRYSVSLPIYPSLKTQDSVGSDGVKFLQYLATAETPTAVYMTGYFDLTKGNFNFDRAREGMVSAVRGTLLGERNISLGGNAGREIRVLGKTEQGVEFSITARYYQVGLRIYVLQFIHEPGSTNDALMRDGDRYFDSFAAVTRN